ncbi:MAG: alanine racemase, partial [Acidimicrobiales bacterium]
MRRRRDALVERIAAAGRDPASVTIVAVTKGFGADAVRAALDAGLTTLGENYVDELEAKRAATRDVAATWHFLGALQTNKIARALAAADVLCALSRAREAERVAALRPGARVYVEVDYTDDPGRA